MPLTTKKTTTATRTRTMFFCLSVLLAIAAAPVVDATSVAALPPIATGLTVDGFISRTGAEVRASWRCGNVTARPTVTLEAVRVSDTNDNNRNASSVHATAKCTPLGHAAATLDGLEAHVPHELRVRGDAEFASSTTIRVTPRDVARGWSSPVVDMVYTPVNLKPMLSEEHAESRASVAADFNGDGYDDVFVINSDVASSHELYINDASGTLRIRRLESLASLRAESRGVVTADFDGDGKADVFVVNNGAANDMLLGDGAGGFRR